MIFWRRRRCFAVERGRRERGRRSRETFNFVPDASCANRKLFSKWLRTEPTYLHRTFHIQFHFWCRRPRAETWNYEMKYCRHQTEPCTGSFAMTRCDGAVWVHNVSIGFGKATKRREKKNRSKSLFSLPSCRCSHSIPIGSMPNEEWAYWPPSLRHSHPTSPICICIWKLPPQCFTQYN